MPNITFIIISSIITTQTDTGNFLIDVKFLQPINRDEIKLKVQVTNFSNKTVNLLKYRRQDFRREKIKAIGNYVIEIQKNEGSQYNLFIPSADIDPTFQNQEYISIRHGDVITDTLYINGYSFSRSTESKRGFPPGKYRLKISFNSNMWNDSQENCSNWIEFNIE